MSLLSIDEARAAASGFISGMPWYSIDAGERVSDGWVFFCSASDDVDSPPDPGATSMLLVDDAGAVHDVSLPSEEGFRIYKELPDDE